MGQRGWRRRWIQGKILEGRRLVCILTVHHARFLRPFTPNLSMFFSINSVNLSVNLLQWQVDNKLIFARSSTDWDRLFPLSKVRRTAGLPFVSLAHTVQARALNLARSHTGPIDLLHHWRLSLLYSDLESICREYNRVSDSRVFL